MTIQDLVLAVNEISKKNPDFEGNWKELIKMSETRNQESLNNLYDKLEEMYGPSRFTGGQSEKGRGILKNIISILNSLYADDRRKWNELTKTIWDNDEKVLEDFQNELVNELHEKQNIIYRIIPIINARGQNSWDKWGTLQDVLKKVDIQVERGYIETAYKIHGRSIDSDVPQERKAHILETILYVNNFYGFEDAQKWDYLWKVFYPGKLIPLPYRS